MLTTADIMVVDASWVRVSSHDHSRTESLLGNSSGILHPTGLSAAITYHSGRKHEDRLYINMKTQPSLYLRPESYELWKCGAVLTFCRTHPSTYWEDYTWKKKGNCGTGYFFLHEYVRTAGYRVYVLLQLQRNGWWSTQTLYIPLAISWFREISEAYLECQNLTHISATTAFENNSTNFDHFQEYINHCDFSQEYVNHSLPIWKKSISTTTTFKNISTIAEYFFNPLQVYVKPFVQHISHSYTTNKRQVINSHFMT